MSDAHDYLSTACFHGLHGRCRLECKFCARPCRCSCHGAEGEAAVDVDEHIKSLTWSHDYWEHLAISQPPRFWVYTWKPWYWRVFPSSDERTRRTLVIGPLVIALPWRCRCPDCRWYRADLVRRLDEE